MSAVKIDIHLHVSNINTVKNDAAAGWIFHTVQAPQEGTFSGTRRSEHRNDITLVKETSVVSFVAVADLYMAFNYIGSNSYDFIVPYLVMAVIYIVLVLVISLMVKLLERSLRKSDRRN